MDLKRQYFEAESDLVRKISEQGISSFVAKLDLEKGLQLSDRILRCMDERTPGGIHSAGSTYLLGFEEGVDFCLKAKVEGISWHRRCGAVELGMIEEPISENPSAEDVDSEAEHYVRHLAEKLGGIPVVEEKLADPHAFSDNFVEGHHIARAIYYLGVDFDPTNVAGLPTGFVINRNYLNRENAIEEAEIAKGIAFGGHGFGNLYSANQPLLVIPVCESEAQLEQYLSELEQADFGGGAVSIGGFVAA